MWTLGCGNVNGSEVNMSDSFNGRKLRPLIPRPTSASPKQTMNSTITTHPYIGCIHGTDLFAFNPRLEQSNKRDLEDPPLVSSRWNPTPEQLQALEDMYRCGTRTPSAEQIQKIAAQLRRFGKIEGKNVFYWFQNHKARERQKRRRESEPAPEGQQDVRLALFSFMSTGLRRTGFEAEETQNWAPLSNCSTLSEESVSKHRGAAVLAASRTDGWIQLEERELQQRRDTVERHATWQMMESSSPSPPIHLVDTIATPREEALRTMDAKYINRTQNYSILFTPNTQDDASRESQTLQLFPLRSNDPSGVNVSKKDPQVPMTTRNTNFTPSQFFEFLPLKN
ncbi:hypothetical protein L1049_006723 [Liquidambar formosana]|uniref:Homeobox domain-containing protein n=1 Tax=Liquidambar formosana TaxID=63359 RepID=A0AAP0RGB4_LIQFO